MLYFYSFKIRARQEVPYSAFKDAAIHTHSYDIIIGNFEYGSLRLGAEKIVSSLGIQSA